MRAVKSYILSVYLFSILFLSIPFVSGVLFADVSTGWRSFMLGEQEPISDDVFSLENLEFIQPGDVMARVKIKNVSIEDASICLSIAFFDAEKSLLTALSFTPSYLRPGDEEYSTLEFPGSREVLRRIRYYQASIVERAER